MLTPEQLASIPNNIVDLYAALEEFIIIDFSRRLKKTGEITSTAEWQKERAKMIGIRNIEAKIAETLNLTNAQIESLFPDIALVSLKAEQEIYKAAKLKAMTLDDSKQLREYLSAAIKNTKGDVENITQSLGFATMENGRVAYSDIATFYQKELNLAQLKISTGVTEYNTAIKQAIKKISDSGLRQIVPKSVDYPSGWSNEISVAVRRSVLTGSHQMAQQMSIANMDKVLEGTEIKRHVEVSKHSGERPSHKKWSGKIYEWN